ncbi:DUF4127 family protein [Oscillibacter hominis]|uniref:DUF4127 family protein n=1 Tax=Oscillibacter hominis TaxID=2763056 RepID=A0A7G9B4H1_9FIRM|nr:DUF4127 family protein [Oscillibacter hominis]QNL44452.1 DUF4127 family protein [Oscillibacter hominis]
MKKLLCLLLTLLLTGCGGEPVSYPDQAPSSGTVAYVPLDDRPVNSDRAVYLAQSLGFEILLPDQGLYHTSLDGQERNPSGTAYGDRGALWQWVAEQDAAGCDLFILSLDQLLSGGLVSSRSMTGSDPILLSDGTALSEEEAVKRFLLPLCADSANQVYLLDTVMRLAPTVGYDGFDLAGYEALRSYGMAERPTLSNNALTICNIVDTYPLSAQSGTVPIPDGLTEGAVEDYLQARERKLRLISSVLDATEDQENIHFLIGVDDSAPSASIQTNELSFLRQAVEGRGAVLSGADEIGMLALCRMYEDVIFQGRLPAVRVRYFGGSEERASSDYDHQPLTEIVDAHLDYLGLTKVSDDSADFELLVLTAPADTSRSGSYCSELIRALRENEKSGLPTALMDAAKNAYGTSFQSKLVKEANLGSLLGYAGFYDLANATGITLANAVARWLCLSLGGSRSAAQEEAFVRTLADSLIKDICYKNDAKIAITQYVKGELGGDPDNFAKTGTSLDAVLPQLNSCLDEACADLILNLNHSNLITSLSPYETAGLSGIGIGAVTLPWQRVFELRMELTVGPFVTPHRKFLFFYT